MTDPNTLSKLSITQADGTACCAPQTGLERAIAGDYEISPTHQT